VRAEELSGTHGAVVGRHLFSEVESLGAQVHFGGVLKNFLGLRTVRKDVEEICLGDEVVTRELPAASVEEIGERLLADVELLLEALKAS
jgi:hypothetical protein